MADALSVNIDGLKELEKKLRDLGPKVSRNALRSAVSAGARVIRAKAASLAPVDKGVRGLYAREKEIEQKDTNPVKRRKKRTKKLIKREPGTLKRAIYIKQILEESNQFQQTYYVGVRSGKKYQEKKQDAFYWRFLEFGTQKMGAQPFIRPAFEGKKTEASERIKNQLAKYIEKVVGQK